MSAIDRALHAVLARAEEHRLTLCIGRTHGVHAEPTTFGLKLAVWAFELDRDRERLARALEGFASASSPARSGPTRRSTPRSSASLASGSGSSRRPRSTQILQRDRHADLLAALAVDRSLARQVRARDPPPRPHRGRRGAGAVRQGQKGSSAMPHKRNPVVAERICGLARVVRAGALVGLENVALWHERDISHSSAERVTIPDAFLALDYMLDRFSWLVDGLVVRPEQMRRNLDSAAGSTSASASCSRSSTRVSRATMRTGSCRATRCAPGKRSPTSPSSCGPTRRSASASTDRARRDFRPRPLHAPRGHRLRSPGRHHEQGGTCSCLRLSHHVASGKVRELYELDSERLLLDRERPNLGIRRRPADRDPGQGPRSDRAVRLLVLADEVDRPQSPDHGPRRTAARLSAASCDAADRVRRARLPGRLRLEGLPRSG